jgi:pimeloyl-ACP methyl ester carboxylesterase
LEKAWQDKYVDVDGVKVHYLEGGKKENEMFFLVHGGGAGSCAEVNYGDVIDLLSKDFHVVAADNVGFGSTPGRGPQDYTAEAQGNFLIRILETIGKRAHLTGNSHGGWLIQYIAHLRPDLVGKLVIINSLNGSPRLPDVPTGVHPYRGPPPPPTAESIRDHYGSEVYYHKELLTEQRVRRILEVSLRNYEYDRARTVALHEMAEKGYRNLDFQGKHISEYAHRLKMPVLLTWGRDDPSPRLEYGLALYSRIPGAEMHILPNAKHHVMADQPERWASVVANFLKSPTRAR